MSPRRLSVITSAFPIRVSSCARADVWINWGGIANVLPFCAPALVNNNGRKEVLEVLVKRLDECKLKKLDMGELVAPTLNNCLQDKSAEVRGLAEKLLIHVIQHVGANSVRGEVKGMKKAS